MLTKQTPKIRWTKRYKASSCGETNPSHEPVRPSKPWSLLILGVRLTMLDMFEGEGAKRAPGDLRLGWAGRMEDFSCFWPTKNTLFWVWRCFWCKLCCTTSEFCTNYVVLRFFFLKQPIVQAEVWRNLPCSSCVLRGVHQELRQALLARWQGSGRWTRDQGSSGWGVEIADAAASFFGNPEHFFLFWVSHTWNSHKFQEKLGSTSKNWKKNGASSIQIATFFGSDAAPPERSCPMAAWPCWPLQADGQLVSHVGCSFFCHRFWWFLGYQLSHHPNKFIKPHPEIRPLEGMVHHNLVVKGPLFPLFPEGWEGPQGSWDLDSTAGALSLGKRMIFLRWAKTVKKRENPHFGWMFHLFHPEFLRSPSQKWCSAWLRSSKEQRQIGPLRRVPKRQNRCHN